MPVHDRDQITPPRLTPQAPSVLGSSAVPLVIQQGTVAANGIVTLNQAMPAIYANAWLWLPAGAVVGGAAGWYFVKFTSTTQGQVYSEYRDAAAVNLQPGIPTRELFAAVGSASAYAVPTNTDIRMFSVPVPGNSMGADGCVLADFEVVVPNNVNTKTSKLSFGTSLIYTSTGLLTSQVGSRVFMRIANRGVANVQRVTSPGVGAGVVGSQPTGVDTTVDQALSWAVQLGVATDYLVLESFKVDLFPCQ